MSLLKKEKPEDNVYGFENFEYNTYYSEVYRSMCIVKGVVLCMHGPAAVSDLH
jgi:hypothetical protein